MTNELEKEKLALIITIETMLTIIRQHTKLLSDMNYDLSPRSFSLNLEVIEDAVMVLRKNEKKLAIINLALKNS